MQLVVLAKSPKKRNNGEPGNCVAGIGSQGNWVRLVSNLNGDSLSDNDCNAFACLDVIEVEVSPCPIMFQTENFKLERFIRRLRRTSIRDVVGTYGVSNDDYCFINNEAMLTMSNRRYAAESLMLIRVSQLEVYQNERNRIKARFTYNNIQYTDIAITDNYYKKPKVYGDAYLVMSLPSETGGFSGYYKFIASVYPV